MRVIPTLEGNIELSDVEDTVLRTLGATENYQGRMAVIHYLKRYCNADKVLQVIQLRGSKVQGCYTICPIAATIGNRTPEQYIADCDQAYKTWRDDYLSQYPALKKMLE